MPLAVILAGPCLAVDPLPGVDAVQPSAVL